MLKKMIVLLLSAIIIVGVISGCGTETKLVENKLNVYTSFFPLYDIARTIGGDAVNVVNLIPAGVEAHDWTPKSRELSDIGKADLLIYSGAGFEGWIDDFKKSLDEQTGPQLIEASAGIDLIEVSEEEVASHADEHADEHGHDHGHGHEEEPAKTEESSQEQVDQHSHGGVDPHVWLSPLQAQKLSENIYNALVKIDPENADFYKTNYKSYISALETLHHQYAEQLAAVPRKELVVQHQAYGYLCRDYALTQKAIMGISPDAEPTAQDMKEISEFVKQNNVKYIMFEELVSDKVAKTLADDLDIKTIVFSPIEGLTEEQEKAGETYISMMERNLKSLVTALQ